MLKARSRKGKYLVRSLNAVSRCTRRKQGGSDPGQQGFRAGGKQLAEWWDLSYSVSFNFLSLTLQQDVGTFLTQLLVV